MSFLSISWFLLSLIELSCFHDYSFRKNFWDYDVHPSTFHFAEIHPTIRRRRHKNRLTMYCYKSRFRGYSKYLESKVWITSDSNPIKRKNFCSFRPSVQAPPRHSFFQRFAWKKWWVRKNSNLRPPLYQSGILTNWTTDPAFRHIQKEIFRQSLWIWPISCYRYSL